MLWNNWQIHQGKAPLFGAPPSTTATKGAAETPAVAPNASIPAGAAPANSTATPGATVVPGLTAAAPAQSETVTVKTDVLKLTFDLQGAQLVRADLLAFPATDDKDVPFVLLERGAGRTYVVQSGLTGAPAGSQYPTHLSSFTMISEAKEISGDTLVVKFAAESAGIRLIKTYTLRRGQYVIDVAHQIENTTAETVNPSVYLQITRDGVDPNQSSAPSFLSGPANFLGAAVYSEQDKFQKVTFAEIEKHKASYIKQTDNGWFGMIQHYFVTAWVPPQGKSRHYEMTELEKIFSPFAVLSHLVQSLQMQIKQLLQNFGLVHKTRPNSKRLHLDLIS